MIFVIIGWICLFTICQCKVITVNNAGTNSSNCCTRGLCLCRSFIDALIHLEDNTTVNITSQSVTLDSNVTMGSKDLNNVTVLGNGVTVTCNHQGSVVCRTCTNVIFEGITWDRCGNPKLTTQGIWFIYAVNITISLCTFQYFNTCIGVVFLIESGFLSIQKSHFLFNQVGNASDCPTHATLFVSNNVNALEDITVIITETLFYHNGMLNPTKHTNSPYVTINMQFAKRSVISLYVINSTISASNGLGGYFIFLGVGRILAVFNDTMFINNMYGGSEIKILNLDLLVSKVVISSSTFAHNIKGSLKVIIAALNNNRSTLQLDNVTIYGNKGSFSEDSLINTYDIGQGAGILLWFACYGNVQVEIAFCNILDNFNDNGSIVFIGDHFGNEPTFYHEVAIVIISSSFANNYGSALHLSNSNIQFKGYSSFNNNTAQSGAAIQFTRNSQATIGNDSTIEFINNVALLFGGAIYIDLPFNCLHQGITFTHLPNNSLVLFTNNSARIAGNSLYFSIPESCNITKTFSDNNSIVYIPYQFTYTKLPHSVVAEISTSPFAVNLCSTICSTTNTNSCFIRNRNMLGQSVQFNATACDLYNNVSESVQFLMECIDCDSKYRLSDNKILAHNGISEFQVFAMNSNSDILSDKNITINMMSISSHRYKHFFATVSVKLSPCHAGYVFDSDSQQCKCYNRDQDIIQCQQDHAEIKYGHWFGIVSARIRTSSLCPTYYCDFDKRVETRNGYYNLPEEQNDQCSSHRAGMACGECVTGYTLAFDSPDCINTGKCSTGITVLVLVLTILYWILVVLVVFGLMYLKINISLGYVYGVLFYYSIVDILLGSNLYVSVGVFQVTTLLSSFAKLTPQFLGTLCFVQGLSGIDQQFIHYAHALAVFLLTIAIVMAARRWPSKIASIVNHCIIRVICLLLLLAYTSLVSTSLQLLRPLYYHDVDGAYVYLSPSIKYFTDRHVAYSIVACVCGLFIVIGFPLLLFLQPFVRSKVNFIKIKPLLDQFQGCYKDQYHWFAAYYLICRLIIIGVIFINNFNNSLFYLQTVSIIIVTIHISIQPYKSDTLNMLDGVILLTIILIVNLGSYTFERSTTITIVIILVIFPLGLGSIIFLYFLFLSDWINKRKESRMSKTNIWYVFKEQCVTCTLTQIL